MANTSVGLNVMFTANANGMAKGLTQTERYLQNLGKQASQAARLFDGFTSSSGAAATAQQQVATDIAFLTSAYNTGQVSAEAFATTLRDITVSAQQSAAAFAEGARITENVATAEERRVAQLQRLDDLLAAGAISQETYSRAVEQASGAAAAAAAATAASERERARVIAEGAAVTQSLQTVQEKRAAELERLSGLLSDGAISEETYARAVEVASGAQADAEAAERARQRVLEEGARIAEKYATDEEKRAREIARLDSLLAAGAISEETYARAIDDASGAKAEAARVDQQRASDSARAAQIIEANLSAEERASRDYAASVAELDRLVAAGLLTEADYAKAVERSAAAFAKATVAAARYEDAADGAGDAGVLKFNELSGVLAAIPGPIGNVAGRLSGLASAGEGLGRVFSGGIGQGLTSIGASVAGLVNPFTAGLAAVAAFGAGATAVASSLVALEDRVERLGRLSNQLGVSFDFVQVLEEAGNRADVSIEQLSGSFARLQNTLAGGDEESKKASDSLRQLGVTVAEFGALSEQQRIELIGERLATIEDPAQRSAAAIALFGRSGVQLLPFFNELDGAANDIERLGSSVSDLDRARLAEFGAGIDALGVATRGLGQELTLPFLGLAEGIAQGTADFLGGVNAIASAIGDILAPEMDTLGNLFEAVGAAARVAADIIASAFRLVQQVLEPIGGSILPAVGAGIAFINRQILVGAVANLARFFTAASAAAVAYATSAGTAAVSTAALGVAIRGAINSTGVGVLVTGFGLAAGALLEWAFSSDEATKATEKFTDAVNKASSEASRFGEAGAQALDRYKQRLETIAELQASDVFSPERAKAAADQARQGFEQTIAGFNAEAVANNFSDAIGEAATAAAEFGQAGFEAAFAYQQSLQQISELLQDNTLTADEAKRAAEQEKAAFEARIKVLDEEAKARERVADAAKRAADAAIQADQRRADSFIATQGLGGEDPATKAAEDLLAITRQIEEAEAAIVAARAAGDAAAEQAATRRLAILDQAEAAAQETVEFGFSSRDAARAIEEVRGRLDETFTFDNFELAPEAFAAAQEQLRQLELDLEARVIDPDTFEEAADAIRKGFDDALRTAEQIRDLNEQYAERAAEIDAERIQALSQVSQQPLQIEDVRTGSGISEFLRLATGREDPAIAEYRKQLSELQKIAKEIRDLGGVVEIVGAN
jgi:hypothetical protein